MGLLLPPDWRVPATLAERLGSSAGRQRAMAADGHLLLVLHQPPAAGEASRAPRFYWRDPAGSWAANHSMDGASALRKHVAAFTDRADELEKQWQAAKTAADYFVLLQAIAPIHRTARNLHAVLQQARDAVPADRDLIDLRDRSGEVERALELLHADTKNGLDFTVAHQTEQQAHRMYEMAVAAHRLNLLAAIFFPVVTLAAVFGMNLGHGLDATNATVFWGVLGAGLVAGALVAHAVTRTPPPPDRPDVAAKRRRR